jgi:hypothetical protein
MQKFQGGQLFSRLCLRAINLHQTNRTSPTKIMFNGTPPHPNRHHPNLINGSNISRPTRPSIATRHRTHLYRSQCLGGKERRPTPERKDPDIFSKGTITTHAQTQPEAGTPPSPLTIALNRCTPTAFSFTYIYSLFLFFFLFFVYPHPIKNIPSN